MYFNPCDLPAYRKIAHQRNGYIIDENISKNNEIKSTICIYKPDNFHLSYYIIAVNAVVIELVALPDFMKIVKLLLK